MIYNQDLKASLTNPPVAYPFGFEKYDNTVYGLYMNFLTEEYSNKIAFGEVNNSNFIKYKNNIFYWY